MILISFHVVFLEYVRSAVVSIIQLLNSGKLFGTGLSLGAHLVPKRLARTSVCLIAREESSDPGVHLYLSLVLPL